MHVLDLTFILGEPQKEVSPLHQASVCDWMFPVKHAYKAEHKNHTPRLATEASSASKSADFEKVWNRIASSIQKNSVDNKLWNHGILILCTCLCVSGRF